jgi:ATP-dependent RNA helicase DeaD
MQLPTVEDVNTTRLARFDEAITEALANTVRIDKFRDIVAPSVRENDVPEVDVAAALAVVMQGDTPLLLDPEQERPVRMEREFSDDRGPKPRKEFRDRGERPARKPRGRTDIPMATYRISVGKRHKVEPRQIVGAIANEGGLGRQDFGHIDIRGDHSLVELPADLPGDVWSRLSGTRISGKLIELTLDAGGPTRETSTSDRKKPRHK